MPVAKQHTCPGFLRQRGLGKRKIILRLTREGEARAAARCRRALPVHPAPLPGDKHGVTQTRERALRSVRLLAGVHAGGPHGTVVFITCRCRVWKLRANSTRGALLLRLADAQ